MKFNIKIESEKDLASLKEFLRRYNLFNKDQGFEEITLQDAGSILLHMALDENPAEKLMVQGEDGL